MKTLRKEISKLFHLYIPFLWVDGMAVFPFIFIRKKNPANILLNHERIHLRQQLELLIIPFYLWYLVEYLYYRLKGFKHYAAYRKIRFEKEAFEKETDLAYLKKRNFWAFLKF